METINKIIYRTFQVSLFLLVCYGAHAWFTWDYDFLDYRGLIPYFVFFSIIAFVYQIRFGIKLKKTFLLLLIYLSLTIAQSFPVLGYSVPISTFFKLYPLFVLLNDKQHIQDHIDFLTKSLCVVIVPGIVIWGILFFYSFPGYPIQWGDLSINESYFFLNYVFYLKDLYYIDSIRFQSVFLEPSYFGTLLAFLLYANKFSINKVTIKILLIGVVLSFSLAAWIITLLGYVLYRIDSGFNLKWITVFCVFLVSLYAFALNYNDGNNAINELIVQRLELDNSVGIKGNNRFSQDTDIMYDMYKNNYDLLWGHKNVELKSSAGYKVYFIQHGIVSAFFCLLFYLLVVLYSKSRKYGLFFVLLLVMTFIQAAYPSSYAWVIPFVLGVVNIKPTKINVKLIKT
jgi:hypothetical protein